jgi:hypothetical protein
MYGFFKKTCGNYKFDYIGVSRKHHKNSMLFENDSILFIEIQKKCRPKKRAAFQIGES